MLFMSKIFKNWSESVVFMPKEIVYPKSIEEVQKIVRECNKQNRRIRMVGAGHSFSSLIETDDCLMSLDLIQGIINIEPDKHLVTVHGGTKLKKLGEDLLSKGFGMENLGDIDVQSVAGAICSKNNSELFDAARVSLGCLGIIVKVKLKVLPAFKLKFIQGKEKLDNCLNSLSEYNQKNRNFEFYYFPHTDTVQTKFVNLYEGPVDKLKIGTYLNDLVLENGAFKVISEISRVFPSKAKNLSQFCAKMIASAEKKNWSNRIFAVPRLVKFYEMEYNIPREFFQEVIKEIAACIKKEDHRVHFPIECRFVKKDEIWLSPAFERDSAYIAVHMYKGMEHKRYFNAMEEIFKKYQGRPHWGKMHTKMAQDLINLYPKWNDFLKIRKELDPKGMFLNDHLKQVFGLF
jgi:FAD/FMN-containing dehydrogenase